MFFAKGLIKLILEIFITYIHGVTPTYRVVLLLETP